MFAFALTVIIVHKEDQAVPTILQRLDAAEKSITDLTSENADLKAQLAAMPTDVAEADAVTALGKRMDAVEAEIGTEPSDPAPADPDPAAQSATSVPLSQATFG